MDDMRLVQKTQRIEELLRKHADQGCTQPAELVLLDQFVEIDTQQLEDQAEVLPVDEGVLQPEKVVIVILVEFVVELEV